MSVPKKRNRLFGGIMLIMMTVLAVYTAAFAMDSGDSSYSLVIQKKFDTENLSPEVLEAAKKQKYEFQISGYYTKDETDPETGETKEVKHAINKKVTLPRENVPEDEAWKTEDFVIGYPYNVTVSEITDNIALQVDGKYYNMSQSTSDATIRVRSRTHELSLKNNSDLMISRPENGGEQTGVPITYHLTNRLDDDHPEGGDNFIEVDKTFTLDSGETWRASDHNVTLRAGIYTIEQLAAPNGYTLKLDERKEDVPSEKAGTFYINGNPGTLKLTAGGTAGDGRTHRYTINRTDPAEGDASTFEERIVTLSSGETYTLDDLPKGGYTVTEYVADVENKAFQLTATQERPMKGKTSALNRASDTGDPNDLTWKYFTLGEKNFAVSKVALTGFGPLYNKSGNKLNDTTSYGKLYYAVAKTDKDTNEIVKDNITRIDGPYTGNQEPLITEPSQIDVFSPPRFYFAVADVKSKSATHLEVRWTEYGVRTENYSSVDENGAFTVDSRKTVTITAPAPSTSNPDHVSYCYTITRNGYFVNGITDAKGNKLPSAADGNGNRCTVILSPGETVELRMPSSGSYKIRESIDAEGSGFTMQVSGQPFNIMNDNNIQYVTVGGERKLIISKSFVPEDERTYSFYVYGNGLNQTTINLTRESPSQTITLPHAGTYTIQPGSYTLGYYDLNYTDSGAIYGTTGEKSSTVTFTNTFSEGDYAYRYINEYYVRNADGKTYELEGVSPITTIRGRSDPDEIYTASQIRKEPNFKGQSYTHFDEDYGWVTPLDASTSINVKPDDTARPHEPSPTYTNGIITSGKGFANTDKGATRELEYAPVANWTGTQVTTDAREIVILRYYRERNPVGKYKVVHEYYLRDEKGDTCEGQTQPEDIEGELGVQYTAENNPKIQLRPFFDGKDYEWDNRAQYGEWAEASGETDSYTKKDKIYTIYVDWKSVKGTEEGTEIIILRYYRTPEKTTGSYRIVHEYYYREIRKGSGGSSGGFEDNEENIPEGEALTEAFSGESSYESTETLEEEKSLNTEDGEALPKVYETPPEPDAEAGRQPVSEADAPPFDGEPQALEASGAPVLEAADNLAPVLETGDAQPEAEGIDPPAEGPPVLALGDAPVTEADVGGSDPVLEASGAPVLLEDDEGQPEASDGEESADSFAAEELRNFRVTEALPEPHENDEPSDSGETKPDSLSDEEALIEAYAENDGETGGSGENDGENDDSPEDDNSFAGTLNSNEKYIYTYEGRRDPVTRTAPLGTTCKETDLFLEFAPEKGGEEYPYKAIDTVYGISTIMDDGKHGEYSYIPDKEWASAKENGEDIIIVRYWRGEEDPEEPPEKPDNPPEEPDNPPEEPDDPPRKPKDPPKDPDDPPKDPEDLPKDPETPPETPETPPEEPETPPETPEPPPEEPETPPETPEYPTELPDPNDPNSPEEITIIGPNGVPLTYIKFWDPEKEEWVYLPEDEIPLAPMDGTPQTGDEAQPVLWGVLCAASLGAVWAMLPRNRKKRSFRRNRQR